MVYFPKRVVDLENLVSHDVTCNGCKQHPNWHRRIVWIIVFHSVIHVVIIILPIWLLEIPPFLVLSHVV